MTYELDTPNFEHKMRLFPCCICLVKAACRNYIKCALLTRDLSKIYTLLQNGRCPDCGNRDVKEYGDMYGAYNCPECHHNFAKDHYNRKMAIRF